jgi:hypothetical protein
LEIVHQHSLNLSQDDLEDLALRWPSLETLNLNTEPFDFQSSNLTLEALLPFARHCPNLAHLGLFIDASSDRMPTTCSQNSPLPSFRRLHRLATGLSVINDPTTVAVYLSKILPLDCSIESGIIYEETLDLTEEQAATVAKRYDLWAIASHLLPVLTSVRMEEQERAKEMKRELSELQARMQILVQKMDKFSAVVGPTETCLML